jgi:hypothetical protein
MNGWANDEPALVTKVVSALLAGRSPRDFLDAQRARHLEAMHELTVQRRTAARVSEQLAADYRLFHIEADLRWIAHAEARLTAPTEPVLDITDTLC